MASNVSTTIIKEKVDKGFNKKYLNELKERVIVLITFWKNKNELKEKVQGKFKNSAKKIISTNISNKSKNEKEFQNNITEILKIIEEKFHNKDLLEEFYKKQEYESQEYIILESAIYDDSTYEILYLNKKLYGKQNSEIKDLLFYKINSNFQKMVNKIKVYLNKNLENLLTPTHSGGKRIASYKLKGNNKKKP